MEVTFGVLGPVAAWAQDEPLSLKGPRHRAVLARLLVARRRMVPVTLLVDDLWDGDAPPGAVAAVRTFVASLRRAVEPDRPPRGEPRLLVTEGPGYALRPRPDAVDAWRFEAAVTAADRAVPSTAVALLEEALGWWRGPAYADVEGAAWARAERGRLTELRLHAVERLAEARVAVGDAGAAARAVADLDAHVAEHPWREEGWRLLALALYRTGRQADALAVLRRARHLLVAELGVDPGAALRDLELDVLRHADHLLPGHATPARDPDEPGASAGRVWAEATAAYDRTVAAGTAVRLESTVGLLRSLAVTGGSGLLTAREHRVAAIAAAEERGDAELTARIIGAYDVPAVWTRVDDAEQASAVVAAAERTLARLDPCAHPALRARLLATVAVESRGDRSARGAQAAHEAEHLARALGDPALLAFALNGVFMQSFGSAGLAPERDAVGAELVDLAARTGLVGFEVLGRLVRLQARCALGDVAGADEHAAAADRLAARHDRPLVGVFTTWYRALRLALVGEPTSAVASAYRDAARTLVGAGMPGLERGLLPLALVCLRAARDEPVDADDVAGADLGPYAPWVTPLVLLAQGRRGEAAATVAALPDPPRDLLSEALWCLAASAAADVADRAVMERARAALAPAALEHAAGSGVVTAGPVAMHLAHLDDAVGRLPA